MEKVFSIETFFGFEQINQRLAYLEHFEDTKVLSSIVTNDEYWVDHIRSISDRFGFALKARLDISDPKTFRDMLRKFIFSGMIGCCYLTNRTIDAFRDHGETMFSVYRLPSPHECNVITLVRPTVRKLLYHFEITDNEFKEMVKDLCEFIYSTRFHEQLTQTEAFGAPKPNEIIPGWKPTKLQKLSITMLKKIVSPHLSNVQVQSFEHRLKSIDTVVEQR